MRIGDRQHAFMLVPDLDSPNLRERDKKSLLWREPVDGLRGVARGGFLKCQERELEPADVGDVLTQGELAVEFDIVDCDIAAVLLLDARRALAVATCIVRLPPVAQVPFRVVLAAGGIETLTVLVSDHHSDATI